MIDWITDPVFGFTVEKHEVPRMGGRPYYPNTGDLNVVLHTTEGGSVAGALSTLAANNDPSHFTVGEGRIIQLRPLSAQAASLHLNPPHNPNNGCIQIEMVGFSKQHLWLPETGTLEPTCALLAWLSQNLGIPLAIPNDWPDDGSDIKTIWSSNNTRRQQAAKSYPLPQGVWMHMEIPWQQPSWHWDCGAIERTKMITKAMILLGQPE